MIFAFACNAKEKEIKIIEREFSYAGIKDIRKDIIDFFLNAEDSPISKLDKDKFVFDFYSPNPYYFVKAKLNEFANKDTVTLLTSKENKVRRYIKFGLFEFKINNKPFKLICYLMPEHKTSLFVPFLDETNGNETYEAGRYLDIEIIKGNNYILDFNICYSPYCAYNKKYSCPIVPKDNYLKLKIEAGEKYHRFSTE